MPLHRQFYHFAMAVAERMVVEKKSATDAVGIELQCFTDLLEEKMLLGLERQIGLAGELLFLERLLERGGGGVIDSWIGPAGEPHDFRIGSNEFEVKTTVRPHRVHTIHGIEQLAPSQGCTLSLISVMLGPAGASDGFSLSEKVEQLSAKLSAAGAGLMQFTKALKAAGFHAEDASQYTRRFARRRPLAIIPVDGTFPSITRPMIQASLGSLAARVEAIQYEVNLEGLEHEDGSQRFENSILA